MSALRNCWLFSLLAGSLSLPLLSQINPALRAGEIPSPCVKDGSLASYSPVWSDEFDGTSLDLEKWGFRTDSKMWSTQKPDNVEVSGGTLKLHLKKEEAGDKHYSGSGVISKASFRYGYYEARMKIPPGAGWHTSFWMMLHNSKGGTEPAAACQELDVIENDSIHKNSYGVNIHKWKTEHISFGGKTVKTPDLSAAFHVYGCLFTPDHVTYFFDGDPVQSVDVTRAARRDHTSIDFEHGDQNIWLTSIASSLGSTKAVDDAALPAVAEFDYVRYFKTK
jgi:beta-glucanase (GH16 family)